MISRMRQLTTSLLLASSVAVAPIHAVGNNQCCAPNCAPECTQACEEDYCCQPSCSSWGSWVGGALLGAAAGAAAGAAVSNGKHGKHGVAGPQGVQGIQGAQGATGAPGTNPFILDGAKTIAFTGTLTPTVSLVGSTITFFVTMPDGEIHKSAPIAGGIIAPLALPAITTPAMFGDYSVGVEITAGALLGIGVGLPLAITATPSAGPAPTTSILDATPALTLPLIVGSVSQTAVDYTYFPAHGTNP